MIYAQLYNDRKGLSQSMTDAEFAGPALGPLSGITWKKGVLSLEFADQTIEMQMTEYSDHIRYGGGLYNSLRIITREELYDSNILFCGPANAVHSIDIIKTLVNV